MRGFIISLMILINFILQSTLFQHLKIGGIVANTALILIISIAVHTDKIVGATVGLAAGLLQDILLGRAVGLNGALYMVIGYTVGYINKNVFKDSIFISMFLTMIGTVLYEIAYLVLVFLMGYEVNLTVFFQQKLLIQVAYNSIISMIFYFYVSKLFRSNLLKK